MKGVADRTLELMNEYQSALNHKSWRTFQHFLVVKIEESEAKNKRLQGALETYASPDEWTNVVVCIGENPDGTEWEFEHEHDAFVVWNRNEAGWGVAEDALLKGVNDG